MESDLARLRTLMDELPLEPRHRALMVSMRVLAGVGLGITMSIGLVLLIVAAFVIGSNAPFADFVQYLIGVGTLAVGGALLFKGLARLARRIELAAFRFALRRFQQGRVVPALASEATSAAIPGTPR